MFSKLLKMKNISFLFLILFTVNFYFLSNNVKADTKSYGRDDFSFLSVKNSNFKKGNDALKQAKKYEKKEKKNKAKKRFDDAIKYFTLANQENPNEPDILFRFGFSLEKVGDLIMAEIYYEQGIEIDPYNINLNRYLGELYFQTGRIDKAKKRLKVLENCECVEFKELKILIQKN